MSDTLTLPASTRALLVGITHAMRAADQLDDGPDRDTLIDDLHDVARTASRITFPGHRARAGALSFELLKLCSAGDPSDVVDVAVQRVVDAHP